MSRFSTLRTDAARHVDPDYAAELDRAAEGGVEVLPLKVDLRADALDDRTWKLIWALSGLLPWRRTPARG